MNGFQESLTNIVEIEEVTVEIMLQILEYFYLGKYPKITAENAITLYFASSLFIIDEFKPVLRSFIRENLDLKNVKDIIYVAEIFNDEFMNIICAGFLANNIEVLEENMLKDLPFSIQFLVSQRLKKYGVKKITSQSTK